MASVSVLIVSSANLNEHNKLMLAVSSAQTAIQEYLQQQCGIAIDHSDTHWRSVFCHSSCFYKRHKEPDPSPRTLSSPKTSLLQKRPDNSYERLEFLGDRVLALRIAELLYHHYPESSEGGLAKRHSQLVNTDTLDAIAQSINIEAAVQMHGNPVSKSVRADVIEALIGYLFLQHGNAVAHTFIDQHWQSYITAMTSAPIDPRSRLQEYCMRRNHPLPVYQQEAVNGSDHQPIFTFSVEALKFRASAQDSSKQTAKKSAASALLEILRQHGHTP